MASASQKYDRYRIRDIGPILVDNCHRSQVDWVGFKRATPKDWQPENPYDGIPRYRVRYKNISNTATGRTRTKMRYSRVEYR